MNVKTDIRHTRIIKAIKFDDGTYLRADRVRGELRTRNAARAENVSTWEFMEAINNTYPGGTVVMIALTGREITEAEANAILDAEVAEHEAEAHAAMSDSVRRSSESVN